jgi:hypothetical protein
VPHSTNSNAVFLLELVSQNRVFRQTITVIMESFSRLSRWFQDP